MKNQFKKDGLTYEVVLGRMSYNRKIVTAQQILSDKELREELLTQAWQGPYGKRDEEDFYKNGIFKIVYEEKSDKTAKPVEE